MGNLKTKYKTNLCQDFENPTNMKGNGALSMFELRWMVKLETKVPPWFPKSKTYICIDDYYCLSEPPSVLAVLHLLV